MQDIKGSDIFSDEASGRGHAAGAVPGLSDAKKKALYSTSVFNEDGLAAAPQVCLLLLPYAVLCCVVLIFDCWPYAGLYCAERAVSICAVLFCVM